MYQKFRNQISEEVFDSFTSALTGQYSLFIDDRPTGTGKTYQLPYLTRIVEEHGIKRSFVLTPQKEQRDELCNKYFLQHYSMDEVIVIAADGELFAKEAVWTDDFKRIVSELGLKDLIREIDRQIHRHREGLKEYSRNSGLENEKAGIIESERILGKYRGQIWKQLTKQYKYNPRKRCFLKKDTKERAFTPADESVLRRLFPMELDEVNQYKVIIMTFQKNLHGMSQNTFDNLFFSSDITSDSAIFIDESDEFYKSILNFLVERALRSDVSLIELLEYIYRFIPKYSKHTQKLSESVTVGEAASKIRKDIAALLKEYKLFVGSTRDYVRNLKLKLEDDGSIMIVQYSGYTSDFGNHLCIYSPENLFQPAIIHASPDDGTPKNSLKAFVQKALWIIDRTAGFIRAAAFKLYSMPMRTDEEAILNALSIMQFRDSFLSFMFSIVIPEKGGLKLRSDRDRSESDPFRTGITVTRFEDDPSHEPITRIRTLYIKMLPAYWMRTMIRNARFVMLISATARMDAMNDFPRKYISCDDSGENICYEMDPDRHERIQDCIMEMKKLQYGDKSPHIFISRHSTDCIYDNLQAGHGDDPSILFPFGVSSITNGDLLENGGGDNLAFIIQQMVDVIRYRRSVNDKTFVHEIYLTRGFKASEIADVITELGYVSKDFSKLFEGITIGSIKAGNISFLKGEVKNCRTDNIHIREGQKVFIVSAYVSGGRGYDHTVHNDSDGKAYNVSGISCKRPAHLLPGLRANMSSAVLLECACNLINGGYICNDIWGTYRVLTQHLASNRSCYPRDFKPEDDLSPYKQTENAILTQTIGRFRMDTCADITTIHIDRNILEKDRCLKRFQFDGRTVSYELNEVLNKADDFYRKQFTEANAVYKVWNDHADEFCRQYTKHLLPSAKKEKNLKNIRKYAAVLEAMKIASVSMGRRSMSEKPYKAWLKAHALLQKGAPIRVTQNTVKNYAPLFWNDTLPDTAMSPGYISQCLYKPVEFLSDLMPDGAERIRAAFAPLYSDLFRNNILRDQRSFSVSEQGAGFLKGEIGERFAEEIFRYVIKHGAYSEFRVYSIEERLTEPYVYQYEDFDGILAPNVFWDAKNIKGDLLLVGSDETAEGDKSSSIIGRMPDPEDKAALWSAMKNKISRMPSGQMNYLIYFSTQFIGNRKVPLFYRPTRKNALGRLCKETGRDVTVIVISSLFTDDDERMTTTQKHNRIMSMIGRKVLERILKEMENGNE